jgi:large subunit ribosomal protein L30
MKKKLKVTLKKSPINKIKRHKRTLKALGLTKIGKTRIFPDNSAMRGMLEQVAYLVAIEEIKGEAE